MDNNASDDAAVRGTEEEIRGRLTDEEYAGHMDRLGKENVALVCRNAVLDEFLTNNASRSEGVLGEFRAAKKARVDREKSAHANDAERLAAANEQIAELIAKRDGLVRELERLLLRST